jgi:phosphoglycolate phosphatase
MDIKRLERINNFIFDFDGTIIDSSEDVLKCVKKALEESDVKFDESLITPDIIGPPLEGIIQILVEEKEKENEDLINHISSKFRDFYENNQNDKTSMYEGVFGWLTDLKKEEKRLFIATNKPKLSVFRYMENFNLNMFEAVYTIDKDDEKLMSKPQMIEEIIKKYNLKQDETIMIGDAPSDINAAHKNSIKGIGALWGYGSKKEKLINISDYIIELNDLKKI